MSETFCDVRGDLYKHVLLLCVLGQNEYGTCLGRIWEEFVVYGDWALLDECLVGPAKISCKYCQ